MTLTEFLLARFAEDEEVAREALFINPKLDGWHLGVTAPGDGAGGVHEAFAALTVGPGRILAECDAKRRIVAHHGGDHVCLDPESRNLTGEEMYWDDAPCEVAKLLALPYAAHPDYQLEWKP